MTRVANLGMYDMPHLCAANDALWAWLATALVAAGIDGVPARLDRSRPLGEIWRDDRLLVAQTCGYPLVTDLRGVVRPVAAPVYDLPGCDGPTHCSILVVPAAAPFARLADLRGGRVAINGRDSNTGMNLLRAAVAPLAAAAPFFGEVIVTGAHLASLAAVARGAADLAAVDAVTVGLTLPHRPDLLDGVRIIGRTQPSPTLPFVTRAGASDAEVELLREALAGAVASPALAEATRALALAAVVPATVEDYAILARHAEAAAARGYPELA